MSAKNQKVSNQKVNQQRPQGTQVNRVNILGHRGARAEIAENTQEGFIHTQRLIANGLAGIEFDIQLTADAELLVTHDDTLDRICNRQGHIEQLTASYCQTAFAKHTGYSLPILEEVIPHLQGYSHIELEIKTHERMDRQKLVDSLASKFDQLDNANLSLSKLPIVLTSFDQTLLQMLQYHPRLKAVPRGLLVENPFTATELIHTALRLNCCQIAPHFMLITEEVIKLAKRHDLQVSTWTVNDIDIAKYLIAIGIDTIITDHPTRFLKEILTRSS